MKNIYLFFLCLVALSSFWACEVQLDDSYYRELNPDDSNTLSINLSEGDSVFFLKGNTRFSYVVQTGGLPLQEIRIYVNDSLTFTRKESIGTFELKEKSYPIGVHDLKIIVLARRGNGSLADILGKDSYTLERHWTIIADNRLPAAPTITNFVNDSGLLRIEWNQYEQYNFREYLLKRKIPNGYGGYNDILVATSGVISESYAYDSSFLGGTALYYVEVQTVQHNYAKSKARQFRDDSCQLSAKWLEGTWVQLSWNKLKYPRAVKSIEIRESSFNIPMFVNSLDSMTFTANIGIFGKKNFFEIRISGYNDQIEGIKSTTSLVPGEPSFRFLKFMSNQLNDDLMITDFTKLIRYNPYNNQTLNSINHPSSIGKYVYSPADDAMLCFIPNRVMDPHTFTFTTMLSYTFQSTNLSSTSCGIVSNNTGYYLFDFKNKIPLYHLELPSFVSSTITDDNRYLLVRLGTNSDQLQCYDLLWGKCTLVWEKAVKQFLLIPGSPDKILVSNGSQLLTKEISTFNTLKSFDIPDGSILETDRSLKYVSLSVNTGTAIHSYQVFNYETGEQLINLHGYAGIMAMFDGWVYNSEGQKLQIFAK